MTENVQKDELAEAVREAIGTLREISQGKRGVVSVTERINASDKLIQIASDYPEAFEVFGDDEEDVECDACESLRDELEAAREESDRQFARADSAEKALAPLRERITSLEFGAKESQEAVDDAFETVHRWLSAHDVPTTKAESEDGDVALSIKERIEWLAGERISWLKERGTSIDQICSERDAAKAAAWCLREDADIQLNRLKRKLAKARERRDFFSTALTAVLRHEGAPPGGVNAFVDAIKGREARIAGLLEKLEKISVEFASKEAAITALVNAQEETRVALDAGRAPARNTIADRVTALIELRDREESYMKTDISMARQRNKELGSVYAKIDACIRTLNEARDGRSVDGDGEPLT